MARLAPQETGLQKFWSSLSTTPTANSSGTSPSSIPTTSSSITFSKPSGLNLLSGMLSRSMSRFAPVSSPPPSPLPHATVPSTNDTNTDLVTVFIISILPFLFTTSSLSSTVHGTENDQSSMLDNPQTTLCRSTNCPCLLTTHVSTMVRTLLPRLLNSYSPAAPK